MLIIAIKRVIRIDKPIIVSIKAKGITAMPPISTNIAPSHQANDKGEDILIINQPTIIKIMPNKAYFIKLKNSEDCWAEVLYLPETDCKALFADV